MKDNADSDAGPYHSQNKRKHIKKSQGIVTPLNRVFDYAFFCNLSQAVGAKQRAIKGSLLTFAATAATRRQPGCAKQPATKGSLLTFIATAATRRQPGCPKLVDGFGGKEAVM